MGHIGGDRGQPPATRNCVAQPGTIQVRTVLTSATAIGGGLVLMAGLLATGALPAGQRPDAPPEAASGPVTPERFGARGDGRTDDTAAWRRAARGGREIVASGTYLVSDTIELAIPGAQLSGRGTLIASPSLAGKSLLESRADDCRIEGLTFRNPSEAQSRTGPISVAIRISANRCRVAANRIDRFQNGIVVSADGEYFDTTIENNVVSNVIGVGGGPADRTSTAGEDRGDGIVSWGARTRIVGNQVSAKPGTDARIGIHVEALPTFKRRTTPDDDAGAEIRNNRVSGSFRRAIADEGVRDAVIADNDLPGGYSWWAIAVTQGGRNVTVANNRITFDRHPNNASGSAWHFWPAAIHVAGYGRDVRIDDVTIRDNRVRVTRCGGPGLQYMNDGGRPANFRPLTATGNQISTAGACALPAVRLVGGLSLDARSTNRIEGGWARRLGR